MGMDVKAVSYVAKPHEAARSPQLTGQHLRVNFEPGTGTANWSDGGFGNLVAFPGGQEKIGLQAVLPGIEVVVSPAKGE